MIWSEHWEAIGGRIAGLSEAAHFLAAASSVSGVKEKTKTVILPELKALKGELEAFHSTYRAVLPEEAGSALSEFLAGSWFSPDTSRPETNLSSAAAFAAFRSRFDYVVRDGERTARSVTELAFEHLQRLIVVDEQIRAKWFKAFGKDEPACEKLGAVHLLSHGIWAFKAIGPGAATDLVYPEPIERFGDVIRRTARALVLTEWKLIRSRDEIESKSAEAIRQMAKYAGGILRDVELKRTRYVILVGQNDQSPPPDRPAEGTTYRHIWLATEPQAASVAARKRPRNA